MVGRVGRTSQAVLTYEASLLFCLFSALQDLVQRMADLQVASLPRAGDTALLVSVTRYCSV